MRTVSRMVGGLFPSWLLLALAACGGGGSTGASSSTTTPSTPVNAVPPSQISYGAPNFTFSAGVAGPTLTPTSQGGAVANWSISPALPQGLQLSATDGSISGTPAALVAATAYVITAQNSGGSSTVTLKITVDVAPFLTLGHQAPIAQVRTTASTALSVDTNRNWILWDYASESVIASGNSGCPIGQFVECGLPTSSSPAEIAVNTAVIAVPAGLEVRSIVDGHVLASIAAPDGVWWKLATDGSYVVIGSNTSLAAWSTTSGHALFSRAGDYSRAIAFAAPGEVLVGAGPASASAVESIATSDGTSTLGPQFNGTFSAWFADGGSFTTLAGSTALIYSSAGVQQGLVTSVSGALAGAGNWVWSAADSTIRIYPAAGSSASSSPSFTYVFNQFAVPLVSGMTVAFLAEGSNAIGVVNFSGTTPTRADYTTSVPFGFAPDSKRQPYAAASAAQWLVGTRNGVLVDGATLGGAVRQFGYGEVASIAGGTDHFAIATGSGAIVYFDSATLAQEGQIPLYASKIVLSADGTLLVAQDAARQTVQVYSLPAGTLLYTWSYPDTTTMEDIELSASGTVLGQAMSTNVSTLGYTIEASAPTGGSQVFSADFTNIAIGAPPLQLSPDGSLIAYALTGTSPINSYTAFSPGTNLLQNGTLVTVFSGLGMGWLDNSRLLVNNYVPVIPGNSLAYSGCSVYGSNGLNTGAPCALPNEIHQFQSVAADQIYVPTTNQILSVSTGNIVWASADPDVWLNQPTSAVAGSRVIFVSGIDALAQSFR